MGAFRRKGFDKICGMFVRYYYNSCTFVGFIASITYPKEGREGTGRDDAVVFSAGPP